MDNMTSITRTSPTYHGHGGHNQGQARDKLRTNSGDSCRDRAGPGDRERIRNQLILGKYLFFVNIFVSL